MKKRIMAVALVAVMLLAMATGCSSDKRLIGAWTDKYNNSLYQFMNDGTFYLQVMGSVTITGTYEVQEDIITLYLPETGGSKEMGFSFFGDGTLVLEDPYGSGEYTDFTKTATKY